MAVVLCKCFNDVCSNGCLPEGFALIRMTAPEGCEPTTLYDKSTGKSYPWNATFKAEITDDGCWYSCELPFSDNIIPNITYEIVDVIAGACSPDCDCGVTSSCGCPLVNDELPTCRIWLDSTAGFDTSECVNAAQLCAEGVYTAPCKNPKCVQVPFSDYCIDDDNPTGLGVWYAPGNGTLTIQYASVPMGGSLPNEDITFNIINSTTMAVLFTGVLPAGSQSIAINMSVDVPAGTPLSLLAGTASGVSDAKILNIQTEFSYCA